MVEGSTYRTVTVIKQQPFKCQGGCVWFNSNQNATLGDEEQRRGMETSTYYLLPGEREERDNSGLCLICCGNLREVMFSLIKKEKKEKKKECLFSALSLPSARQPELGCTNEIHNVYSRPELGRIAPRRDEILRGVAAGQSLAPLEAKDRV